MKTASPDSDEGGGDDADIAEEPLDALDGVDWPDAPGEPEARESVGMLRGLVAHDLGSPPGEAGVPGREATTKGAGDPGTDEPDGDRGRDEMTGVPGERRGEEGVLWTFI